LCKLSRSPNPTIKPRLEFNSYTKLELRSLILLLNIHSNDCNLTHSIMQKRSSSTEFFNNALSMNSKTFRASETSQILSCSNKSYLLWRHLPKLSVSESWLILVDNITGVPGIKWPTRSIILIRCKVKFAITTMQVYLMNFQLKVCISSSYCSHALLDKTQIESLTHFHPVRIGTRTNYTGTRLGRKLIVSPQNMQFHLEWDYAYSYFS
jgi:hypothetical protein